MRRPIALMTPIRLRHRSAFYPIGPVLIASLEVRSGALRAVPPVEIERPLWVDPAV